MEDLEELRTENEKNISLFLHENIEELLEMDLEERRRRNIERNRRMFEQLFQSFTQTSQENEEELVQLTQAATDQANNSIEDEAQNLLTLEKKFSTCNNQIRLISHYLDRPKDTSLILSGLWPNQEKRQLVQAVCSIKSVHPIHVNLSEVSSLVDFIRLTTGRLLDTIDIYLSTGKKKSQRYHNALSHCRSIEHLIELLKEIHQELHNTPLSAEQPSNSSKSQLPSVPRNKIVFIFENYHTHELLGIASPPSMRLYEDLSLFTKSRFGVILLTESMNITHYSYKEITVHFPNYTDDEMKQIAIQRLTSLLEEAHNQQPITTLNDIAMRLKGHILKVFGKILEVVPLIRGYGIHSFDKIYSIVILLLQKILQLRSLTSIVQLCIRSRGQSERESDEITAVLNAPIPTMTQLRPLLHQIINPPTYDMTCPADRNMESYENLPRRIRYLILAAFLAHINPKGTDNLKFIGEMTKKRKLSSAISGSAAAEEEKETVAAQRQQDTSRLFSLERLLSIYAQLIFMSERKSMDVTSMKPLYGKVVGFIEVLVNRKLLWRPVPFNLHRPMYGANIPKVIAENIARSMNIALTDFIYDQNQFSSQWL